MTFKETLLEAGRAYLQRVLEESRGKVEVAALLSGMTRQAFYKVAEKHGITAKHRPYTKRS